MNIATIAEKAGVAPSTVSLVLNDKPRVSEATRVAVLKAAKELKYRPGKPGRPRKAPDEAPSRNRTNRIALVVAGVPRSVLRSPVYTDVLHGVEGGIADAGKMMVMRNLPKDEPCPEDLFSQRVDGAIIFGRLSEPELSRYLPSVPCVRVMGDIDPDGLWDHVSYDNHRLGQLAAEYVLARGHRICAFLGDLPKTATAGLRLDSAIERGWEFRKAVRATGGRVHACSSHALWAADADVQRIDPQRMDKLLDDLISRDPQPTAVFTPSDILVNALHIGLVGRKLQMDLVSCNNEQILLANLHPRPATIDIHAEQVGRRGVEQLLWRIEHPDEPRVTEALEPSLVAGERGAVLETADEIEDLVMV